MGRWILLAIAGYILYILIHNELRRRFSKTSALEESEIFGKQAAGMIKDPVCGAYVEMENSISVRDGNTVHRFCSYECRDAFLKKLQKNGREIPVCKIKGEE